MIIRPIKIAGTLGSGFTVVFQYIDSQLSYETQSNHLTFSDPRKNPCYKAAKTFPMKIHASILSEVSQTDKDKYHRISLICGI